MERLANGVRAVVEDVHVDRRRQLRLEERQQVLDSVGHFHGVGPRLPPDGQDNRAAAAVMGVVPRRRLIVFHAVDDVAQFLQPHRRAAPVGHHDGLVFRGRQQLSAGLQREGPLRSDDCAGRQVDVPVGQRRLDFVDADLPRGQGMRIHLHVHGKLLRAQHLHLRHPGDHGNALCDARLGVVVQVVEQ
jgi:hypothetical protein